MQGSTLERLKANNCPDNTNSTGTGTFSDILSSSASPLFCASLPTPLVDLETDGRAGSHSKLLGLLLNSSHLSLLPTANPSTPIDKEGYHFEGLLPTFLVGTSTSTTTTDRLTDRPTYSEDINSTDRPTPRPRTSTRKFLRYTTPNPSPTFPTYPAQDLPQASMSETLIQ